MYGRNLFMKAYDATDAFVADEGVVIMRWMCCLWSKRTQRTEATRVLEILLEHKIPRRLAGGEPACPQENKPKSEGTELLKEILTRLFLWGADSTASPTPQIAHKERRRTARHLIPNTGGGKIQPAWKISFVCSTTIVKSSINLL